MDYEYDVEEAKSIIQDLKQSVREIDCELQQLLLKLNGEINAHYNELIEEKREINEIIDIFNSALFQYDLKMEKQDITVYVHSDNGHISNPTGMDF